MLHADKESASKWKDIPIPFPTTDKERTLRESLDDATGVKQLSVLAPHFKVGKIPKEKMKKQK